MNDVFFLFLSLSLSGSVLALLLFAMGPIARKSMSQSWQYYIWLIVVLRFLLPFTHQVGIVEELVRPIQTMTVAELGVSAEEAERPGTFGDIELQRDEDTAIPASHDVELASEGIPPLSQGEAEASVIGWRDMLSRLWIVWLGTAAALLLYKFVTYLRFTSLARKQAKEVEEGPIYDLYRDECALLNVKKQVPLYVNSLAGSPMLVGLLRPIIILPNVDMDQENLRYIIRHELTHYRRLDCLYKWLVQLILCLHWFNPTVYLLSRQVNKSCELSCDEAVVKGLDTNGRMLYGDALMASVKRQGTHRKNVAAIPMSEDARTVKERLDAIVGYRKKTWPIILISLLLTALLLCGFTFTGAFSAALAPSNSSGAGTNEVPGETAVWDLGDVYRWSIDVASENVVVRSGGTSFQIEVSAASKDNYLLEDYMHVITPRYQEREVSLERKPGMGAGAAFSDTIILTVPESGHYVINGINTTTGDITIENTKNQWILATSESGTVRISNTYVSEYIIADAPKGHIEITNTHAVGSIHANAENGTVMLENTTSDKSIHITDKASGAYTVEDTGPVNPMSAVPTSTDETVGQTTSNQSQQFADSGNLIKSVDIYADVVNVVVETGFVDTFSAHLSYPKSLDAWYREAQINMDTSGAVFRIEVTYPGGEIPQIPENPLHDQATLVVGIPQRQYDTFRLTTVAVHDGSTITIPVPAGKVELINLAGDVSFNIPYPCDILDLNNKVGDVTLQTAYLCRNTSILSKIGNIYYYLPESASNLEVAFKNVNLAEIELPPQWQSATVSSDEVYEDIQYFTQGAGENKVYAEMEIATLYLYS